MNKKGKVLLISLMLSINYILNSNVFAANLFLGGKLERGVGKMYYYVDSSANVYTTVINNSINNWIDTGYGWNPIYMYPVASNYATDVDFYARYGDEISSSILAQTSFYNTNEVAVSPYTSNWFFAKVEINSSTINNYNSTKQQGTITHEIGHAFGLNHQNNNINSIMCQTGYGRAVERVDQISHNAINTLYN